MRCILFTCFFYMFIIGTILGESYSNLDKSLSKINWWGYKIFKTKITSHNGIMKFKNGKFVFNVKKELIRGKFTVDINSFNCEDLKKDITNKNKFESHLKSIDFLNVKKFPEAFFVLKHVRITKDKKFPLKIIGDLIIKGITKLIVFKAKNEIKNGKIYFESEKFIINRKDFNIKNKFNYQDIVIKNDVDLKISIVFNK